MMLACCVLAAGCASQPSPPLAAVKAEPAGRYDVTYHVRMPDPASHLFELDMDIDRVDVDTLRLQLPVWSPGRYARMDFARNVQDFAAEADGRALRWDKENGSLWRVAKTR